MNLTRAHLNCKAEKNTCTMQAPFACKSAGSGNLQWILIMRTGFNCAASVPLHVSPTWKSTKARRPVEHKQASAVS
eukprot:6432952-Amphidinium_carterae.1